MLEDVIFTSLVLAVAAMILTRLRRLHPRKEVPWLFFGFLAHVAAVFGQVWLTEYYGGGDIDGYYRSGVELATAMRDDFWSIFPEMVKFFFHRQDAMLPFEVFGGLNATGSQTIVAAVLYFVLDDSLYAASMAVSMWSYFGSLAIYYSLRPGIPEAFRKRALIGAAITPSAIFWSGTIAKEAVVLGFLGLATLVLRNVARGQIKPAQLVAAMALLTPIAMIKPYVLLPYSVGAGIWIYWSFNNRRGVDVSIKPFYLVIGALVALAGVVVIGRINPDYAVNNLAKSTARIQQEGSHMEGGSYYTLAGPAEEDAGASRQLLVAPLALPTALFRPFLLEVRNPLMFLNSLETTVLLVLFLRVMSRGGVRGVRQAIFASPVLMFCFSYTVLLGTAVGLASTNLGSLSRYRMPFMPFFATLSLVLDGMLQRRRVRDALAAAGPAGAPVGPQASLANVAAEARR